MTPDPVDVNELRKSGSSQLVKSAWIRRARSLLRWSSVTLSKRSGVDFAIVLLAQLDEGSGRLDPLELLKIKAALERAGIVFPDDPASADVALSPKSHPRIVGHLHTLANRPDILRSLPMNWRLTVLDDGLRLLDDLGRKAGRVTVSGGAIVMAPPVPLARAGSISFAEVKAWLQAASIEGRAGQALGGSDPR